LSLRLTHIGPKPHHPSVKLRHLSMVLSFWEKYNVSPSAQDGWILRTVGAAAMAVVNDERSGGEGPSKQEQIVC
jgi:hypothetical protein